MLNIFFYSNKAWLIRADALADNLMCPPKAICEQKINKYDLSQY